MGAAGGAKPRAAKQLPDFVGSFGWCTWDAFYSQVSAEGALHATPAHPTSESQPFSALKLHVAMRVHAGPHISKPRVCCSGA